MNKILKATTLSSALGLVAIGMSGTASAAISWNFNDASCVSTDPADNCGGGDHNFSTTRTYESADKQAVTVSGWANTAGSANRRVELGQITHYGGGLGVRNADAYGPQGDKDYSETRVPEHAIDNDGRFDFVVFDFGEELVSLKEVKLGWIYRLYKDHPKGDSDISVLAYTGNQNPTDANDSHYVGNQQAYGTNLHDNNAGNDSGVETFTSNGWDLIGNYDVDFDDNGTGYRVKTQAINEGHVSSSYWIIGAYNPAYGNSCTPVNYCTLHDLEYFKLLTLAGEVKDRPPSMQVSEPMSALLLLSVAPLALRRRLSKLLRG